jgi:uncharacterized membrane protein HdeD (DUF308 family)
MEFREAAGKRSEARGYAAFLVCGLCVALNLVSYLPAQTFEQAEATEFTTTLALFAAFVISSIVALIYAIKNRQEASLIALLLVSIAFVILSCVSGAFSQTGRTALQLSYAIVVLGVASARILALGRSAA